MPTYEYKCDSCSFQFEVMQSMNDAPLTICEKCGSPIRRVYSSAGIIFKGSGFYVNDYKSKKDNSDCGGCGAGGSCPNS